MTYVGLATAIKDGIPVEPDDPAYKRVPHEKIVQFPMATIEWPKMNYHFYARSDVIGTQCFYAMRMRSQGTIKPGDWAVVRCSYVEDK